MVDPEKEKMTIVIGEKREKDAKKEKPAKMKKVVSYSILFILSRFFKLLFIFS